jgi:hypothetical protein
MKKLLSATAAFGVCAVLGAGSSQADVINNANIWTNQGNSATTLVTSGSVAGTLNPTTGSELSFNDPSSGINTILGFANSTIAGSPWTVNPLGLGSTSLSPPGTIFDFTGTITTTAGEVLSVLHDDGIILKIDGATVINLPVATSQITSNYSGETAGLHTFDLMYGECCTLPAVLEFTVGGNEVTNTPMPEPASLAVFGTALAGFGLIRRRRNRNAA